MSVTEKLTVGIVGAGSVIEQYHLPVIHNIPELDLKWVVDKDEVRAKGLVNLFGLKVRISNSISTVEDVDICLLALPVGYRRDLVDQILARKWNLLCEKPFAISSEEHKLYLDKARDAKRVVGCGLMRRYYSGTIIARKLVASGIFGRLLEVRASEGGKRRGTGWDSDSYQIDVQAAGGGILMEMGSHIIDQLFFITQATGFTLNDAKSPDLISHGDQISETEISISAALNFAGDKTVPMSLALSTNRDMFCGIELEFENGFVRVGLTPEAPVLLLDRHQSKVTSIAPNEGAKSVYQAFYLEWSDMIEAVRLGYLNSEGLTIHAKSAHLATNLIDSVYRRVRRGSENMEAA